MTMTSTAAGGDGPVLKAIPLGGLGEIGLNSMVYEYGDSLILVDAGLMFPEDDMLGVDVVIPDFSYLLDNRDRLQGIFITHGHEDHIGAIPFLLRDLESVPIHGTAFTLALITHKLKEHGLEDHAELIEIHPGDEVSAGPFEIEFIQVCHSIPDGVALAIRTPEGVIIHTGDFKIDHTPLNGSRTDLGRLSQYGEKGVLALLSDSTNVERRGYTVSERRIGSALREIIEHCPGRVIVAVFSSNLHRIQQIMDSARMFGRKVLFNGKSMINYTRIARDLGYLTYPPDLEIGLGDLDSLPDDKVLMLTTGSQGEPMSVLTRMAFNDHKKISVKEGDTIIFSSRCIPGNERAIQKIMNHLYRQGARVIYDQVAEVHVSGHAHREELKLMLNLVRPRYFIPVHGEYRHLVLHRQLAQENGMIPDNCLLAENGSVISFGPDGVAITDTIETGRIFVDGKGVGDVGKPVLRDRRHLAEDGLVIVSVAMSRDRGEILSGPDLLSSGFILEDTKPEILEEARNIVMDVIDGYREEVLEIELTDLQLDIRRGLKKFFNKALDRRPLIHPIVTVI